MAQGQWVNIPGKGRRWQQPSGELMMTKPGFGQGEFFQTRAAELLGGVGNLLGGTPRYTPDQMRGLTAPGLSSTAPNAQQQNPALGRVSAPGTDSGWWLKGGGSPGQQGMFSSPASVAPGATPPLDPYAAQNRAYQQERARVEAMVKSNPDMQKQEIADARAKVRDQGMATWAAANPTLAKKLQPGQVGYSAVQQALIGNEAGQAARMGYGYQTPQQMLTTPPPGVNAPQGLPAVESIGPTETYGDQGIVVDPEMAKKFQELLNQANK